MDRGSHAEFRLDPQTLAAFRAAVPSKPPAGERVLSCLLSAEVKTLYEAARGVWERARKPAWASIKPEDLERLPENFNADLVLASLREFLGFAQVRP